MRRIERLRLFGVLALPERELARASRRENTPQFCAALRGLLGSISGCMVLIALAAVIAGLARPAPGLAIALFVCVLPAWAVTDIKAARRRRRNRPMSGLERALWIAGLTILIPTVVVTALGVALFTFCMLMSR